MYTGISVIPSCLNEKKLSVHRFQCDTIMLECEEVECACKISQTKYEETNVNTYPL